MATPKPKPRAGRKSDRPQCVFTGVSTGLSTWLLAGTLAHAAAPLDFAHEVVPILQEHCIECHGGEESKGGFSLNTRELVLDGGVLEPGSPETSYLVELLRSPHEDERMPPPDAREEPLPEAQIAVLERWIAEDLPWEPGFTFAGDRYEAPLEPRRPELPPGPPDANPIDRIVGAWLAERDLELPEPLDDAAFLRRLSLDLIGVPPAPEELAAFLDDERPDKRSLAIEALLERDVDYADHWITFWNDLLRNAYAGTGYIDGGRRPITRWLYAALHENKPYDEFVRELIAPPDEESAGFIDGIKWRGEVNASQTREIQFSQNVSQVFLGINMKCASCHDSFIDRWTLQEAYGLAAIYSEKPLELHRCDKPTGETAEPAWIFPELGDVDAEAPREKRLEQLAELIVHPGNGRTTRTIVNRLWHRLMGRGIVEPVDAMGTEPWSADLLDFLATYLVDQEYDLKRLLALIANSRAYQSRSVVARESADGPAFRGPVMKRMTAEQFIDSIRQVTCHWPLPELEPPPAPGEERKSSVWRPHGQLDDIAAGQGLVEWDGRPWRAGLMKRDTFQAALGRPNREQVVSSRPDLLSTLEAIHLANGPELASMLREGAASLRHFELPPEDLVERVYLAALARRPTPSERDVALEILGRGEGDEGLADFLWAVFLLPEFQYIQ